MAVTLGDRPSFVSADSLPAMAQKRALPLEIETQALPLPTRSCEATGLLYHPVERSLWMLSFGGSLWRYKDEQWTSLSQASDLMPAGFSSVYSWGFYFYWDESRKTAVCFASGYGGNEHPVMGIWDGKRFAECVPKESIKSSNNDTFVWDPHRNVLVHFVSSRDGDPRYVAGTLHARELDKKGVWRDVGPGQPITGTTNLMGAYDGDLRATVCISASGRAYAWNGTAWKTLPVEATYPWFPYASAPAPRSQGLVFVYAPRETGQWPAHVLEQSKGKLRTKPISTMRASGGMAYDHHADVTYVYGPWLGAGTLQTTLGTYNAGTFSPYGRAYAGQKPYCGPGHLFADEGRSALYWLRFPGGPAKPLAEVLPPPPDAVAHAATRRGVYAIGNDGAAGFFGYDEKAFVSHAPAPADFPTRGGTCLGADYEGDRLLMVSGEPSGYGPFPKDAWLLEGKTWKKLTVTGTAPAVSGGAVTFDPERARWIVAGGRDKGYKDGLKTFETDEKKWRAFPTSFLGKNGKSTGAKHVVTVGYDATSKQTFALAGHYGETQAYAYEGEGVWRLLDDAPAKGAYDVTTRTLAWRETYRDGLVHTIALGALLDAYAKSRAATPKGTSKGKSAVDAKIEATASAPALPNEVWLRYQDDRSDKVWFARTKGSSFTVRWGKRGATLQEKTTVAKSPTEAQTKYRALVKAKLEKGYEHAPEGEAIATLPGLRAWHIKGKNLSEDLWGGMPKGVPEKHWPMCAECEGALIHVATFHADPDRLPLTKHAALMAFVCGNEMCEFWDADMGANRVLLRTAADLAKPTLKAPPKDGEISKRRTFAYEEVFEVDQELEPNAPSPQYCDKVGGYPAFIQGDETPECTKCSKPMRFVAQLTERDMNFTGGGISYIFVCDKEHDAKLLMQR